MNEEGQEITKEVQGWQNAWEVAEEEFERFAEAWRLDTEVETMSDEDADDFKSAQRKITRQIVSGHAVVTDEGDIKYTLFESVGTLEEVTLKRPRGSSWFNWDKSKQHKMMTKFAQTICAGTGQVPTILSRMDGIDFKFLQTVYTLFLGS